MKPEKRLRRARTQNDYSVIKLSRKTGIPPRRIWRLEQGADPRIHEIQALCDALNISADWWIRGDPAPPWIICNRVANLPIKHRKIISAILDLLD